MKTIGITQSDSKFHLYAPWIQGNDANLEIITLSYTENNLEDLHKCDAIVLSGGIDTHPKFYNNDRYDYPLGPEIFNEARDLFEIKVFEFACSHQIPVLAICRGMQLVNIALGGNLIQDLEEAGRQNHRKANEFDDRVHEIFVDRESLLYQISEIENGQVNSAHHQGLGTIADDLMVSAVSKDDVAEAIEYKNKEGKPFLLCVQWHPERLKVEKSIQSFSQNIREAFLSSIKTK
jgi:putative glutamine amidotransferase